MSPDERAEVLRLATLGALHGRQGGLTAASNMTAAERSAKAARGQATRKANKATKTIAALEHHEQVLFFQWLDLQCGRYPELRLAFAIPNFAGHFGNARARLAAGKRAKKEGRKPGVPDIFLPVARQSYHGLFIEMKRTKGGAIQDSQRTWINDLLAEGYRVEVCPGADAAIAVVTDYMGL